MKKIGIGIGFLTSLLLLFPCYVFASAKVIYTGLTQNGQLIQVSTNTSAGTSQINIGGNVINTSTLITDFLCSDTTDSYAYVYKDTKTVTGYNLFYSKNGVGYSQNVYARSITDLTYSDNGNLAVVIEQGDKTFTVGLFGDNSGIKVLNYKSIGKLYFSSSNNLYFIAQNTKTKEVVKIDSFGVVSKSSSYSDIKDLDTSIEPIQYTAKNGGNSFRITEDFAQNNFDVIDSVIANNRGVYAMRVTNSNGIFVRVVKNGNVYESSSLSLSGISNIKFDKTGEKVFFSAKKGNGNYSIGYFNGSYFNLSDGEYYQIISDVFYNNFSKKYYFKVKNNNNSMDWYTEESEGSFKFVKNNNYGLSFSKLSDIVVKGNTYFYYGISLDSNKKFMANIFINDQKVPTIFRSIKDIQIIDNRVIFVTGKVDGNATDISYLVNSNRGATPVSNGNVPFSKLFFSKDKTYSVFLSDDKKRTSNKYAYFFTTTDSSTYSSPLLKVTAIGSITNMIPGTNGNVLIIDKYSLKGKTILKPSIYKFETSKITFICSAPELKSIKKAMIQNNNFFSIAGVFSGSTIEAKKFNISNCSEISQ